MAPPSKKLTVAEAENIEAQLIPYLQNTPSEPREIEGGFKVVLKRPSLIEKSKSKLWTERKFKELGLNDEERYDMENPITFYYTFYGILNVNVVAIFNKEGKAIEFDPKEGKYSFLFEKFIDQDIYGSNEYTSEEPFITTAIQALFDWQSDSTPNDDDLKKS